MQGSPRSTADQETGTTGTRPTGPVRVGPWAAHGPPIGRPWAAHVRPMGCPWAAHGQLVGRPCAAHKPPWAAHGRFMGVPCAAHGPPMSDADRLDREIGTGPNSDRDRKDQKRRRPTRPTDGCLELGKCLKLDKVRWSKSKSFSEQVDSSQARSYRSRGPLSARPAAVSASFSAPESL